MLLPSFLMSILEVKNLLGRLNFLCCSFTKAIISHHSSIIELLVNLRSNMEKLAA